MGFADTTSFIGQSPYLNTTTTTTSGRDWDGYGTYEKYMAAKRNGTYKSPTKKTSTASASSKTSNKTSASYAASTDNQQLIQRAMDEQQRAYDEAKAANEARYGQILAGYETLGNELNAGYGKRYSDAMALLEGAGESERAAIEQQWKEKEAADMQGLVSSGMYNTTIPGNVRTGVTRGLNADKASLNERINQQKLGVMGQLSGDQLAAQERLGIVPLNVMENRTDDYPDQSTFLDLMMKAGYGQTQPSSSTLSSSGAGYSSSSGGGGVVTGGNLIKGAPSSGTYIPMSTSGIKLKTPEVNQPSSSSNGYGAPPTSSKLKTSTAKSPYISYFGSSAWQ